MRRFTYTICVFFAFLSCNENERNDNTKAEITIDISDSYQINISDFIYDVDTIRLETTNEAIMSSISNMHIMGNKFYVLTNNFSSIKIFDYNGKYLSQVDDKGSGPKEYISISSFEIDEIGNKIIIADSFSRRIFIYDEHGKQLEVIQLDFEPIKILPYKNGFVNIYSGPRNIYQNPEMEEKYIHFLDKNGKFIFSAINIITPNRIDVSSTFQTDILESGEIFFQPVLSDIVYKITDNYNVTAFYSFSNSSPHKFLTFNEKKKFTFNYNKNDFEKKETQGYLLTWGEVQNLTDYIFFAFTGWNKVKYVYYSKNTGKTLFIDPNTVSGDKNLKEIYLSYPKAVKGNRFYVVINPAMVEVVRSELPPGIVKTFFNKTDIDTNPTLISFSIRIP